MIDLDRARALLGMDADSMAAEAEDVLPVLLDELEAARRVVEAADTFLAPAEHLWHSTTGFEPASCRRCGAIRETFAPDYCRADRGALRAALTAYRAATSDREPGQ